MNSIEHLSHRIHVWYIDLQLVDFYGKCRPKISCMDPMDIAVCC